MEEKKRLRVTNSKPILSKSFHGEKFCKDKQAWGKYLVYMTGATERYQPRYNIETLNSR